MQNRVDSIFIFKCFIQSCEAASGQVLNKRQVVGGSMLAFTLPFAYDRGNLSGGWNVTGDKIGEKCDYLRLYKTA